MLEKSSSSQRLIRSEDSLDLEFKLDERHFDCISHSLSKAEE